MGQTSTALDFTGFLFESSGFPPSDPGDILSGVGFFEQIGMGLDWDLGMVQLTWHLSDLVSTGQLDIGGGGFYVVYAGGNLDIFADVIAAPGFTDADYGDNPPNATAPATFTDGDLYLHGELLSFYMTYYPDLNAGSYEGYLIWTGGSQLDQTYPDPQGYTIAGTVGPAGAPVPDGYDLETVGQVILDPAMPTVDSTWGQVKTIYR